MVGASFPKASLFGHAAALLGIFLADQGILLGIQTEPLEIFLRQ
jgi:hypothetical protein